jgi:hypothetical protein
MLLAMVIATVVGLYLFVFSSAGNSMIAQKVEEVLKKELALSSAKVEKFSLSSSHFDIMITLTKDNSVNANGDFSIFAQSVDAKYNVALHNLLALEPLLKNKLNGKLNIDGKAVGNMESLKIDGVSDIANSKTAYDITLDDFKPSSINATIKGANLKDLFILLNQPLYCDGLLDLNADHLTLDHDQLKGKLTTSISKGVINSKTISNEFNITNMPLTTFTLNTNSALNAENIDTKIALASSLANVTINKLSLNTKESSIKSDFTLDVANLDKLFFVTAKHLNGSAKITGDVSKAKDLVLNASSNILGGKITANIKNSDLKANLSSIKTLSALNMLIYPEIFDATLDGTLTYNTEKQKGLFESKLADGQIVTNQMTTLIKQFAKFDLTKERFNTALKSSIDREIIISDLNMTSLKSSINGEKIVLNSKDESIDAKLNVNINNNKIGVGLKGPLSKPDVKVDANELIKSQAEKLIKDKLNDKVKGQINNILNKFF